LENLFSDWDSWFGKLKAYRDRTGNFHVMSHRGEDSDLGKWANHQSFLNKAGRLNPERFQRLNEIEFPWNRQSAKRLETWMKRYHELEIYFQDNGDSEIPATHANTKLANWVVIQRQRLGKAIGTLGKNYELPLTKDQVAMLDKLDFKWKPHSDKWEERFDLLLRFKKQHGHCEVGQVEGGESELAQWVSEQRSRNSAGELKVERKAKLDSIDFPWAAKSNDEKWQEMYEQLKKYHADHGDADVPSHWKQNPKLASWVSEQRQRRKQGQMSDENVRSLDLLVFTWKSRDVGTWEDRLAEVAAFKAKHGHCEIPRNYSDSPKLGNFVNNMRSQRNSGKLAPDRIAKLEAHGFVWKSSQTA
jgi:hypothetical protein